MQKPMAPLGAYRIRCSPQTEKTYWMKRRLQASWNISLTRKKVLVSPMLLHIAVARNDLPEKLPTDFKLILSRLI